MYIHSSEEVTLQVHAKVQKWGNSLGIRIKKAIAEQVQLRENSEVDITVSENRLILTPYSPKYTLEGLIESVTRENLHGEVNSGPRVGMEEC